MLSGNEINLDTSSVKGEWNKAYLEKLKIENLNKIMNATSSKRYLENIKSIQSINKEKLKFFDASLNIDVYNSWNIKKRIDVALIPLLLMFFNIFLSKMRQILINSDSGESKEVKEIKEVKVDAVQNPVKSEFKTNPLSDLFKKRK